MKTVNIALNLYRLDELSDRAANRAVDEHRSFLLNSMCPSDFISGDPLYDTGDELQSAYDAEYGYIETNDDPVVESIEANEYLFFASGELAPVTRYTGAHPLSGQTWVTISGESYQVQP